MAAATMTATMTVATMSTVSAADWSQAAAAAAANAADATEATAAEVDTAARAAQTAQTAQTAQRAQRGRNIATAADRAARVTAGTARFLLGLVLDEVYLWFARLGWCSLWNDDVLLLLWFLDQHIDQSLLFVLWGWWDDWSLVGWWRWGLNEDDLVVLLGLGYWNLTLDWNLLWLWWGNVHIDVLLHNGSTTAGVTSIVGVNSVAATCKYISWHATKVRRPINWLSIWMQIFALYLMSSEIAVIFAFKSVMTSTRRRHQRNCLYLILYGHNTRC